MFLSKNHKSKLHFFRCNVILLSISLLAIACGSRKVPPLVVSKFSDVNTLGLTKEKFMSVYGRPITKDIKTTGENLVEELYFKEIIDGIIITTRFKFVNDTLVEQTNHHIDFQTREIKRLERQIKANRRRAIIPTN